MKKIFSICLFVIIVFSIVTNTYASTLTLNHGNVELNKLLLLEDGVTYIPLRLAFTTNMSKDVPGYNPYYGIIIEPHVEEENVEIGMRRKDENGELIDEGRYVKIEWSNEVKNADEGWRNGRFTFIKYDVVNGLNEINWDHSYEIYGGLNAEIKLVPVDEVGDRLFLSLSDIEKIVSFMTDGCDYQVDIISE